jgi:predicted secreted Zn-dependent protease
MAMRSVIFVLGIAVTCCLIAGGIVWFVLLSDAQHGVSGPVVSMRRTSYGAFGATARDLTISMTRWSAGHWAYAAYRVRTPYEVAVGRDGRCAIVSATVELELQVQLPDISWWSSPPDCLRQNFAVMRKAIDLHEEGHVDIAKKAAESLVSALRLLPTETACPAMRASVDGTTGRILSKLQTDEANYDAVTQHGVTQGVKLDECLLGSGR